MSCHHLYRHFAADGALLYVGISSCATSRLINGHRNTADWFPEIARVEIENFETREAARAAEVKAIREEAPKHNRYRPRPEGTTMPDRTNAERQRRYIARLKAKAASAEKIAALKKELAQAKKRIAELENQRGHK